MPFLDYYFQKKQTDAIRCKKNGLKKAHYVHKNL